MDDVEMFAVCVKLLLFVSEKHYLLQLVLFSLCNNIKTLTYLKAKIYSNYDDFTLFTVNTTYM